MRPLSRRHRPNFFAHTGPAILTCFTFAQLSLNAPVRAEETPPPPPAPLDLQIEGQSPGETFDTPSSGKIKAHHLADGEEKSPAPEKEVYPALESDALFKKPTNSKPANMGAFDPVPEPQKEPVIRRLYLVEKLIREHGRAYDYRTITYSELLAILNQLRKEQPKQKKGH